MGVSEAGEWNDLVAMGQGTDIVIRPAESADDVVLAELDYQSWDVSTEVMPRRDRGTPFFAGGMEPHQVLVAELNSTVVGWVRLMPPTPLASNAHVREIRGIQVDIAYRGQGIGGSLVDAACARVIKEGAHRIRARVLSTNIPSRRLFERSGFVVEGILPGEFRLDGRDVDDVLLGRALT